MRIRRLEVRLVPLADCDCCGKRLYRQRSIVDMVNPGGAPRAACPECAAADGCGLEWVRA